MEKDKKTSRKKQPAKQKVIVSPNDNKEEDKTPEGISVGPKLRLEPRVPGSAKYNENKKKKSRATRANLATNISPLRIQNIDFDSDHITSDKTQEHITFSNAGSNSTQSPNLSPTFRSEKNVATVTSPDMNGSALTFENCNLNSDVISDGIHLPQNIYFNEPEEVSSPDVSDTDSSYRAVRHKVNHIRSTAAAHPTPSRKSPKKLQPKKKMIYGRYVWLFKGKDWTVEENMRILAAFQKYGFHDVGKIAEYVKTKTEAQIKNYIKLRQKDVRTMELVKQRLKDPKQRKVADRVDYREWKKRQGKKSYVETRRDFFTTRLPEHLIAWPNIRQWRRLAHAQMLCFARRKEYSKIVLNSLLKRFHDEEEEPSDPQVINVKAIYKYLMGCLNDEIPCQLPPKESALMAELLKDLRLLGRNHDFTEERQFLENYPGATKYRPFDVKDEFKKKIKKTTEHLFDPNAIKVPEEVFCNLSRHRKFVQCFNPLTIPVWMLQKEQDDLSKEC